MIYFNRKWGLIMEKQINGKNGVVIFDDELIIINYKNPFGDLSHNKDKIIKFI